MYAIAPPRLISVDMSLNMRTFASQFSSRATYKAIPVLLFLAGFDGNAKNDELAGVRTTVQELLQIRCKDGEGGGDDKSSLSQVSLFECKLCN